MHAFAFHIFFFHKTHSVLRCLCSVAPDESYVPLLSRAMVATEATGAVDEDTDRRSVGFICRASRSLKMQRISGKAVLKRQEDYTSLQLMELQYVLLCCFSHFCLNFDSAACYRRRRPIRYGKYIGCRPSKIQQAKQLPYQAFYSETKPSFECSRRYGRALPLARRLRYSCRHLRHTSQAFRVGV